MALDLALLWFAWHFAAKLLMAECKVVIDYCKREPSPAV